MEKYKELIEKLSMEGAKQTIQALSVAQQMGMVGTESELTLLIAAGMETVLEEFAETIENMPDDDHIDHIG